MSNIAPKTYQVGTLTYTKGALVILFGWLLWGDFCFILMETVVPSLMPLKFKSLGAPNTIIALVITTIPGIINTVFAANEIVGHQRPVNERQGVIVDGVDLAEFGAHLADFQKESRGKRRERDVTFLDIYPRLAEGDKSIGARVGIDDGLQADFGLVELK